MKGLVVVGIILAVVAATAAAVLLVWRPWAGGIEMEYALVLPPGARARETAEQVARVLERRAAALAVDSKATATADGRVWIRLAGMNLNDAPRFRSAFERRGRLELLAVADRQVQERYNVEGTLPPGYRVGRPEEAVGGGEYEPWSKGPVLLAEPPVVVTSDVARAGPEQRMGSRGMQWTVSIELHPAAAASFDALAGKLYHARPPGMVAVVVDGRIVSMPSIRSESFGGKLMVSGARDEGEARSWSTALAGGELPCVLRELDVHLYRGRLRR